MATTLLKSISHLEEQYRLQEHDDADYDHAVECRKLLFAYAPKFAALVDYLNIILEDAKTIEDARTAARIALMQIGEIARPA